MSADSDPIIEFDVVLKARLDDSDVKSNETPKEKTSKKEDEKEKDESTLASELLESEAKTEKKIQVAKDKEAKELKDIQEKPLKDFEKFASELDAQGLQNLKGMAQNPASLIQNKLTGLLSKAGIHGAIAVAIITLVVSSPEIIKTVVQALGVKGGLLNQDYTRKIDEGIQIGISKDLQFRRAVGLDVIITNQDTKYILTDPSFTRNSLVDIESTRSIRINSSELEYGYVNGI